MVPPSALIAAAVLLAGAGSCALSAGGAGDAPSAIATREIPARLLPIFEQVGAQYRIPWEVLAGIAKEECSLGQSSDPSCTLQPGAVGPGAANFAGASGLMQVGVGGAAGDEYGQLRQYLPDPSLGPHDPTTAVELAALVLIKHKSAPVGGPIDTYRAAVTAYNGSGPQADAYAGRVIADAHSYQGNGSTSIAAAAGVGGCPAPGPGQYANPFAQSRNLVALRIDMGVDYSGVGPIDALGDGIVTYAQPAGTGWGPYSCSGGHSGAVVYRLLSGPDAGRSVYVTEGITPTVSGQAHVSAGEQIATFTGCIEIGWAQASGGDGTQASALGQQAQSGDAGNNRTYCGQQMSDLLVSTGAPAGLILGRPIVGNRC